MDDYLAANKALWEEWTAIHERSEFYDVEGWKAGRDRLRPFMLAEVGDVAGRDLLHLQCHFGLDTLAWARRGARVTGVDFSERAIALARSLAVETGLQATFVCSDVLRLDAALEGEGGFDIVFTSFGVLGWLPDLTRWAELIAAQLRPRGFFYLAELHPFAQVLDDDQTATEPRLAYPYFPSPEPMAFPVEGSYADRDAHVEQPVEYGWAHSLGEVVTALAQAGLRIEYLHEFPFSVFQQFSYLVEVEREPPTYHLPSELDGKLPLIFSLKASKPG